MDRFEEEIKISEQAHRTGCAALSGAEVVLLQAKINLATIQIDLERAARRAREKKLDVAALHDAINLVKELLNEITTRRAAIMEFHRDFRALDQNLTPIRPSSDAAYVAFRNSQQPWQK